MGDTYRDIVIGSELTRLYSVNRLSYRDSGYLLMKYPMRTQTKFSASVIGSLLLVDSVLETVVRISGTMFDKHTGSTIVGWSDIGNADFSITRQNIAGQMYMDWQGQVYGVKKLGTSVMVYGSGGVTKLIPHEQIFGKADLNFVGCKGRDAFAGSDKVHFYIDQTGMLYKIDGGGKVTDPAHSAIGGRTLFSKMSDSLVLTYLEDFSLLLVTDGTYGYQVALDQKTFPISETFVNVTGGGTVKESFYISSPESLSSTYAMYTTGIMDYSIGGDKTIQSVEVNVDNPDVIECCIYYSDTKDVWYQTDWDYLCEGVYRYTVTAKYFKIGLRIPLESDPGFINMLSTTVQYSDRRNYYTTPLAGGSK